MSGKTAFNFEGTTEGRCLPVLIKNI